MQIQGRLKFMNIERLIKDIGKMSAKVLFNKEEKSDEQLLESNFSFYGFL